MRLHGTVVNGVVVLDHGATVPEGTRVHVAIEPEIEEFEYPHPMAPYDREKEIALLQKSHDEMKAGVRGQTLDEFMAELRRDYALPSMPVE
jgi:hypothetical protein